MKEHIDTMANCFVNLCELEHLKIKVLNSEYTVTLTDSQGDGILKGYGGSMIEAINDLHHNLI